MNLPVRTTFTASHIFLLCCVSILFFYFVSRFFFISLLVSSSSHWLFRFPSSLLLVISSFILLWSENILNIISVFLNLFRLAFWPNIWSALQNVPCALEKNAHSAVECYVLYICLKSIWPIVLLKYAISLLTLCLNDLPIIENGLFKPTTIILLFIYYFCQCLLYF